ncbi:MAG TPA: FKBP-type peptidyl-prolyl cis-trans isomerase [Gammaproteobacteria bacterium]|nr:FKBP-type peptidyl-prolyl cis-trans isomerase [Gammaproteobacteria bacterium]
MNAAAVIGPDSEVVMHFTLTLKDGTVAESSREGEPLEFRMGDGTLVAGLERVLYGLYSGSAQTLEIEPQDAFGFSDPANVHALSIHDFSQDMPLEAGVIINFTTPTGDETPGTVVEVDDEQVLVDFNHPLCGHTIYLAVEILAVSNTPATAEE